MDLFTADTQEILKSDNFGWIRNHVALSYMIRRYGYSMYGSDEHKDLCSYFLPTAFEGMYVSVVFKGSFTWVRESFDKEVRYKMWSDYNAVYDTWHARCRTYANKHQLSYPHIQNTQDFIDWIIEKYPDQYPEDDVTQEWLSDFYRDHHSEWYMYCNATREVTRSMYVKIEPWPVEPFEFPDEHPISQARNAYRAALSDLLKPVYIRDVPRNFLGLMGDVACYDDDDNEIEGACIEPHPSSGFGVPAEFLKDASQFHDAMETIAQFGDGDFWKGVDKIVSLNEPN